MYIRCCSGSLQSAALENATVAVVKGAKEPQSAIPPYPLCPPTPWNNIVFSYPYSIMQINGRYFSIPTLLSKARVYIDKPLSETFARATRSVGGNILIMHVKLRAHTYMTICRRSRLKWYSSFSCPYRYYYVIFSKFRTVLKRHAINRILSAAFHRITYNYICASPKCGTV